MNILFLIPPADLTGRKIVVDRVYGCNYGYDYKPAIHLLSSATLLRVRGMTVHFMYCPAQRIKADNWLKRINLNDFDAVVFFTTWLSAGIDIAAARMIAGQQKGIRFIFTGTYPTWKPGFFLINDHYFVVRGEPEETLAELMVSLGSANSSLDMIKGLSFWNASKVCHNARRDLLNVDTLPVPDRSLLKGGYSFNKITVNPATVMCVSRGCSYGCTYCAPHALDQAIELESLGFGLKKPPLRLRSVQHVIDEFRAIAAAGFKGIDIADNQFVWGVERTIQICEGIKALKLQWICYARADHLKNKEMLRVMKEAGCRLIYIGTDSFDQRILNDVHKQCAVKDYDEAVNMVKNAGIEPEISVLIGASGLETRQTVLNTMNEARKMKTHFVHCSIAIPLPNTELYSLAKGNGWIKGGDFFPVDNVQCGIIDLPFLKALEMRSLLKDFYWKQYLSLGFIAKTIFDIRSWHIFIQKVKAFLKFLYYLIRVSE